MVVDEGDDERTRRGRRSGGGIAFGHAPVLAPYIVSDNSPSRGRQSEVPNAREDNLPSRCSYRASPLYSLGLVRAKQGRASEQRNCGEKARELGERGSE
jgi:hypothetical protein